MAQVDYECWANFPAFSGSYFQVSDVREKSRLHRYGFAVLCSCAAAAISSRYAPLRGVPFSLNFVAVAASAWYGGYYAGILATFVSAAAVGYFVIEPRFLFVPGKVPLTQIAIVTAVALFICLAARQRERNERKLAKSEQVFRTLVESISQGFASFDANWTLTYVNSQGAALSGHTPEQLLGRRYWEIFPEAVGTVFETTLKTTLRERTVTHVTEYYIPLQQWVEMTAYPARDGVSVLFQDVTEKVEAEERLRTADRLAIAGRLAATVSHEINNPLAAIGNLLFLAEREPSGNKVREYIQEASRQLFRASHIAKQTLTFYKGKSEPTVVSVCSAVRDALRLFDGRYEARGVRVVQQFSDDVQITIAHGELMQVIANLVSNALDATPSGGEISLQVFRDGDSAIIRVRDSGTGIPSGVQSKIFEAFFTTKKEHGTGLGLYVCKNIVQKYGGTITIENGKDGTGATFILKFPVVKAESVSITSKVAS